MKIITANRLQDGAVIYLGAGDEWVVSQADAATYSDADAKSALGAAHARVKEITDAYLVEVDEGGALSGRERLRESIRREGPTVREDLARAEI